MDQISTDELVACETRVWEALRQGDATADLAQLSQDFLGVYPSGFATRAEHAEQLAEGPTVSSYEIASPVARMLGDNHAVLSYEARFRRTTAEPEQHWYVSSIWQRKPDGDWINIFSQDTVAAQAS